MKYSIKESIMSAKGYVNGLLEKVKPIIAYIVGAIVVILITAWFTGSAAATSVEKVIDARIDARVDQRINDKIITKLDDIQTGVKFLLENAYSDYTVKINKQVEKIKNDPSDIKKVDIEDVMQKWNQFPESRKTDDLVVRYEVIKEWYSVYQ